MPVVPAAIGRWSTGLLVAGASGGLHAVNRGSSEPIAAELRATEVASAITSRRPQGHLSMVSSELRSGQGLRHRRPPARARGGLAPAAVSDPVPRTEIASSCWVRGRARRGRFLLRRAASQSASSLRAARSRQQRARGFDDADLGATGGEERLHRLSRRPRDRATQTNGPLGGAPAIRST